MKRILVPTDFSDCAGNAVNYAVQAAGLLHSEVIVLHVFSIADKIYPDTVGIDGDYIDMMQKEVRVKLDDLKKDIKRASGVDVSVLLYEGDVVDTILDAAHDLAVDLILMGTIGASGAIKRLMGNETSKVMGVSDVPVLVVPHDFHWKDPHKIVLATNHFEQDQAQLQPLFEFISSFSAELEVVVFTDVHEKASTLLENTRKASAYEGILRTWLNNDSVVVHELPSEDLEDSLEAYVVEHEIDCIVMIIHKRKLWQRLFHPSVTKKMSYHTRIPLLALPG